MGPILEDFEVAESVCPSLKPGSSANEQGLVMRYGAGGVWRDVTRLRRWWCLSKAL